MQVLTEQQAATLRAVVDRIVPPDALDAGGVDAGAYDFLLRHLAPGGYFPEDAPTYRSGLDAIEAIVQETAAGANFADLSEEEQDAALNRLEAESPALFRRIVEQTQEGFYTSPAAYHMIGWRITG